MLAALCCIMSLFILTGCKSSVPENTVFSVDDLSGKKIGVQLGTTGDTLVSDYEEDGSGTVVERYNKGNDAILALKQVKSMPLLLMSSLHNHLSRQILNL